MRPHGGYTRIIFLVLTCPTTLQVFFVVFVFVCARALGLKASGTYLLKHLVISSKLIVIVKVIRIFKLLSYANNAT